MQQSTAVVAQVQAIPLSAIRPDPQQHRTFFDPEKLQELAASIAAVGQTDPIEVTPLDPPEGEVRYQIVAGERRYRACLMLEAQTILAVVQEGLTEGQRLTRQVTENLQREQVGPMEEARAYRQLIDLYIEQAIEAGEIASTTLEALEVKARAWAAQQTGKPARRVAYYVALFALPAEVQTLIAKGALDVGHGTALLRLTEGAGAGLFLERQALQVAMARKAVAQGYSVERLTAIIAQHIGAAAQGAMFDDADLGGKDRLLARANTKAVLDRVTEAVADAIKRTWDDTQQHFKPQVLGKGELEVAVSRLRGACNTLQAITGLVQAALEAQEARQELQGVEAVPVMSMLQQQASFA